MLELFDSSILLPLLSTMPKKKSPEDFLQRARAKGSDVNKGNVNVPAVKEHIEPKIEQDYARALN